MSSKVLFHRVLPIASVSFLLALAGASLQAEPQAPAAKKEEAKPAEAPKSPAAAPAPGRTSTPPGALAPSAAPAGGAQPALRLPVGGSAPPATPAAASAPANDPKAVEIINRYLDAVGGLKILEGIEDRTTRFRNKKHEAAGETEAVLNLFLKKGYKIREEWDIVGVKIKDNPLSFAQVYNGNEGWVQMFGTVSPLEGKTLSLFVWDKFIDDMFCTWEADGYTAKYSGTGTVDNDPVEIIELTDFGASQTNRYFFSKATGLLSKKEWREQGQTGLTKKETFFKRYRKIPFGDNTKREVQFALLQEIYEDGDLATTREYTEVKFNSGLKDGIFERPEGEEFKGAIGGTTPPKAPEKAGPAAAPPPGLIHPPLGAHPPIGGQPPAKKEVIKVPATAPAPAPAPSTPEKK